MKLLSLSFPAFLMIVRLGKPRERRLRAITKEEREGLLKWCREGCEKEMEEIKDGGRGRGSSLSLISRKRG